MKCKSIEMNSMLKKILLSKQLLCKSIEKAMFQKQENSIKPNEFNLRPEIHSVKKRRETDMKSTIYSQQITKTVVIIPRISQNILS